MSLMYLNSLKLEDRISKDKVYRLYGELLKGNLKVVEPAVSFNEGVRYPKIEELLGVKVEAQALLDELCEEQIFKVEIDGNVVVCPRCGSHRLMLSLLCPRCGSKKVVKAVMLQHLSCGHVDFEANFKVEGGLRCPRCRGQLNALGSDYKVHSTLYSCDSCGAAFSDPRHGYTCDLGHSFNGEEAAMRVVKLYRFNEEKRSLIERLALNLEEMLKPLADEGWRIESPARIPGLSGVLHDFELAVTSGNGKPPSLVASLVSPDEAASANEILALWAKAKDVNAERTLILAVPGLQEENRKLAENLGITVVEGRNSGELKLKLQELAENLKDRKT
ncbi:MAG: hypothetical protein QFX33_02260 [Candidatus Nezhaarchaeota archaeon]|nr:hypothetical protein [Candidatus Nezhaarchaeota archaeon]